MYIELTLFIYSYHCRIEKRPPTTIPQTYTSTNPGQQKIFSFPAAEVIFLNCVDDEEYHLIWLTSGLVELIFNRRAGTG